MTPEEPRTIQAVYVGIRADVVPDGYEASYTFHVVNEDGTLGEELSFRRKGRKSQFKRCWVGEVYNMTTPNGTSFTLRDRVRDWSDQTAKGDWRLAERQAETFLLERKAAKDEGFGGLTLDELALKYHNTIGSAKRAALLSSIIQTVTR